MDDNEDDNYNNNKNNNNERLTYEKLKLKLLK